MGVDVDVEGLRKQLGFRRPFPAPDVLAQAMVHRSYLNEVADPGISSNERLEFLGDAVLGCVIAAKLYDRYPRVPEGRLTELRSYLVKAETLAVVGERMQLGRFLVLGKGEEATGGRTRPLNLARVYEAVVGAVFVGCGFARAETFILHSLKPELDELGEGELPSDAKSQLQHLAQTLFGATPHYRTVGAEGPDHARVFIVEVVLGDRRLGAGRGHSKRVAERQAAIEALALLREEAARAD